MIATAHGDVYVGQIAMGADMPHTVKVLAEAEAHRGPSLVIAYSHCIAHGIDMSTAMTHQRDAVASGYWPLGAWLAAVGRGKHPFHLDSKRPSIPVSVFASKEARFAMLARSDPMRPRTWRASRRSDADARWRLYEQMAEVDRGDGREDADGGAVEAEPGRNGDQEVDPT